MEVQSLLALNRRTRSTPCSNLSWRSCRASGALFPLGNRLRKSLLVELYNTISGLQCNTIVSTILHCIYNTMQFLLFLHCLYTIRTTIQHTIHNTMPLLSLQYNTILSLLCCTIPPVGDFRFSRTSKFLPSRVPVSSSYCLEFSSF